MRNSSEHSEVERPNLPGDNLVQRDPLAFQALFSHINLL